MYDRTNLLVESNHGLVLLLDLLDLLLHSVEGLGVGLGALLGGALLELEGLLDILRKGNEGRDELGREIDGRSGEGRKG